MKKSSATAPLLLLIITLSAIGLWFVAANNLKTQAKEQIEQANTGLKMLGAKISYKKITRTGFPFNVGVAIEEANVHTNIGQKNPNAPEYLIKFKRPITATSNLIANTFRLNVSDCQIVTQYAGNWSTLNVKSTLRFELALDSSYLPHLMIKEGFKSISAQDLVQQLKSFSLHAGPSQVKDINSNKNHLSFDASYIQLSRKRVDNNRDRYSIDTALNNMLASNEVQTILLTKQKKRIIKDMLNGDPTLVLTKKPESFSLSAEARALRWPLLLSAASKAPSIEQILLMVQKHPIDMTVKSFSHSSDFGSSNMSGSLALNMQSPKNTQIKLAIMSQARMSDRVQRLIKEMAKATLAKKFSIEATDQELNQLIPNFTKLGTLSQHVNFDMQGLKSSKGLYKIDSQPYQFDFNANTSPKKVTIAIHTKQYAKLFDNVYAYAQAIHQFLDRHHAKLPRGIPQIKIANDFPDKAKAFLRAISDNPSSTSSDITITISSSVKTTTTDKTTLDPTTHLTTKTQTKSSEPSIDTVGTMDLATFYQHWDELYSQVTITPRTHTEVKMPEKAEEKAA